MASFKRLFFDLNTLITSVNAIPRRSRFMMRSGSLLEQHEMSGKTLLNLFPLPIEEKVQL